LEKIILEGVVPEIRGQPRRRWVLNVIDELGMTASDAEHLAQDGEHFRVAVVGAKFLIEQATT
jgi:stress-induced morphogen